MKCMTCHGMVWHGIACRFVRCVQMCNRVSIATLLNISSFCCCCCCFHYYLFLLLLLLFCYCICYVCFGFNLTSFFFFFCLFILVLRVLFIIVLDICQSTHLLHAISINCFMYTSTNTYIYTIHVRYTCVNAYCTFYMYVCLCVYQRIYHMTVCTHEFKML